MSILQMSVSAGMLVIVIVIIRAVALNRLPKTMFCVLWGVALCRLLIPVPIPSRFSVYSIIGAVVERLPSYTAASAAVENSVPIVGPTGAAERIVPPVQEQAFSVSPPTVIWLAGMFTALIFFAVVYLKNHRELRFALPLRDGFLDEWFAEHRLLRPIAILQSDRITTPVAVGIVRPRIILPKYMNMDDKQLLRYVLTHEYYHIRRFDTLWKLISAFALCLHWFNPLVWVMFILINRDVELACDEMVLRRFGADTRTAYACSIIGMAEKRRNLSPLYSGFSKNAAEERIVSIMKYKKSTITAIVLAVVLVAGVTTAFATGSTVNERPDDMIPVATETPVALDLSYLPVLEGKSYIDLTGEGKIQVTGSELENYQLFTNSTNITVSIPKDVNVSGEFILYCTEIDEELLQLTLDANNPSQTFAGCTSIRNYYIKAVGVDDIVITVSDEVYKARLFS